MCTFRSEIIICALIGNLLSQRIRGEALATIPKVLGAFCDYAATRRDKMRMKERTSLKTVAPFRMGTCLVPSSPLGSDSTLPLSLSFSLLHVSQIRRYASRFQPVYAKPGGFYIQFPSRPQPPRHRPASLLDPPHTEQSFCHTLLAPSHTEQSFRHRPASLLDLPPTKQPSSHGLAASVPPCFRSRRR